MCWRSTARRQAETLKHDPEKCEAVFRKDHASKILNWLKIK
jgi:hypothetical protein